MDVTIHGDDWSQTLYWPDALPDAQSTLRNDSLSIGLLTTTGVFLK